MDFFHTVMIQFARKHMVLYSQDQDLPVVNLAGKTLFYSMGLNS